MKYWHEKKVDNSEGWTEDIDIYNGEDRSFLMKRLIGRILIKLWWASSKRQENVEKILTLPCSTTLNNYKTLML